MNKRRVSLRLPAILAGLFYIVSHSPARADNAGTEDLLTSKPWTITFDKGWSLSRTFTRDGVFSTPDRPDETGRWKITGNTLVQTYPDGRKDVLVLPLNAAGTAGVAKDGETMKAVLDTNAPNSPMNAGMQAQSLSEEDKAAATRLLLSGEWKVQGLTWTSSRVFAANGTFITPGDTGQGGRWKFEKNAISLNFTNGHVDWIFLPIGPKGTRGAAQNGEPVTLTLSDTPAAPAATPTPANPLQDLEAGVPLDEADRDASIALLVSAPWKNSRDSGGWSTVRIFSRNNKFTTPLRRQRERPLENRRPHHRPRIPRRPQGHHVAPRKSRRHPRQEQPRRTHHLDARRRGAVTAIARVSSAVNIPPVSNIHHQHNQHRIVDLINDAMIPDAKPVKLLIACIFRHPGGRGFSASPLIVLRKRL